MKAIVRDSYGPLAGLTFRDLDPPDVHDDDVLLRVHAAGVSIGDWLTVQGLPYMARPQYGLFRPKHAVPGYEAAGRVEAVGRNVTDVRAGDEVFGWCPGAFAEEATAPAGSLAPKPSRLSFEQAAAVPVSGTAAFQALRDAGRLEPGQRVLVIGASGGVGTYAVQIAKALGGEVTGVCHTRNVDLVRSIGADHVIDYTRGDVGSDGRRYDLVLDTAGNRSVSDLRHALLPEGTLVIVGGSGGRWTMGFGRTIRAAARSPFTRQRLRAFLSKESRDDLISLSGLIDAGAVTPVIDRTFPLAATRDALEYVGERHTRGKSVITV